MRAVLDHFANFRFDQVVPLDARLARPAHVRGGHRRFIHFARHVTRFARQIGQIGESRRDFVAPADEPHAEFDHRGHGRAIERAEILLLA